ncbi:MAG: parallel beta-helix domain-containing protein [Saprospiraceae bacterium]|nr:right-handed parallel beta-helix repeat-containing protein [Lewinella sp.]
MKLHLFLFPLLILVLLSCQNASPADRTMDAASLTDELQKRLINAQEGEEILLPEGHFVFQRALSLTDVPKVTIKGAGKGKTVLSFKKQIEGAQGLLVKNADGITLEGFTVADSKGDAIKVQDCTGVTMRDLEATWTGGKLPTNGGYGLYPVSCKEVLMENCAASFAMDAGIYVGQCTNVVVRNNQAHDNVAGLEIENTIMGEVHDNTAWDNAGGMLIFDMPDLPQANGDKIKFYNNVIRNNNGENFAPEGMVVSTIPPGSGMILMAHSNIELYDNQITNHKTLGVAINSWLFTGMPYESEAYDPFCSNIYIHDNEISGNAGPADATTRFGQLITALFGGEPVDIITDGIFKPDAVDESGKLTGYCFRDNGEVSFVNLNAAMGTAPEELAKNLSRDMSPFDCELPAFDVASVQ